MSAIPTPTRTPVLRAALDAKRAADAAFRKHLETCAEADRFCPTLRQLEVDMDAAALRIRAEVMA